MKKALIATPRIEKINVARLRDDRSLRPDLRGDLTDLRGEIHPGLCGDIHPDLRGNLTGLRGNLTGLRGDLDDCELSEKERAEGVDIRTLAI